jgi:transposase InsO family protein
MGRGEVPMSVRRVIVDCDPATMNVTEFCRDHGVSTWFFWDLRRRFASHGEAALSPGSRAPKRVANRLGDDVRDEIVRWRKLLEEAGLDAGAASIAWHHHHEHGWAPSEASIWRVLRQRGFVVANPRKAPKRALRRFQADRANELWQIDATKWELADGTIVEILNVLDDASRVLVASRAVGSCTIATTWQTLCSAASTWGWPEALLSDNARAFRGSDGNGGIVSNLQALGIRPAHSRPYHPQTCGKVERFHQTLKKYLTVCPPAATLDELQAQLDTFTHHYNHRRSHRGIDRDLPARRWASLPRSGPADRPLTAPTKISTTVVSSNGVVTTGAQLAIAVGAEHARATAITVTTGTRAHVFVNGRLVRTLTIDHTRRYQALHHRPGRPTKEREG